MRQICIQEGEDMKKAIPNLVSWFLIELAFALTVYLSQSFNSYINLNAPPSMLLTLVGFAFALLHCARRYGWKMMLVFFAITVICVFAIENLSIVTGFPLGKYHFSDLLGVPNVGSVPVTMPMPAFTIIYLSWTMADLILDGFSGSLKRGQAVLVPIAAAFFYAMWDTFADQHFSASVGLWVYDIGGGRFGTPYITVFGMFFYGYIIFQLYTLCLLRYRRKTLTGPESVLMLQSVMFYLTYPSSYLLAEISAPDRSVTTTGGQVWYLRDLYQTSGSIAFVTAVFVAFLAVVSIINRKSRSPGNQSQEEIHTRQ
jgi:putative membrane protein